MKNPLKKLFYLQLEKELQGCKRILDLGCGNSSILQRFSGDYYSVGVDAFAPYLEESRKKGIHDEYILSDISAIDFSDGSFDVVIASQVIEHFTKEDALHLMKKMERWAKKKIILTTPNGFVPTEEEHVAAEGSDLELMQHRSGWTVDDFAALGYRTRGYQGFRRWLGVSGFGKIMYYVSFPFSYFFSRGAYQLVALKDITLLYQDVSVERVATHIRKSRIKLNPTFFTGVFPRKVAWGFFSLRVFLLGRVKLSRHGLKQRIKDEAEREVLAPLRGALPRLNFNGMVLVSHDAASGVIDFLTLIQQIFIRDQYHARRFIQEDFVVLDAGANVGVFSAFAASLAKQGTIYAFEPADGTRKTLEENTKHADNIVVVPLGLGERAEQKTLAVNLDFSGSSTFADSGVRGTVTEHDRVVLEPAGITTIDQFVKDMHLSRVDFIKMDTEGYEKNILRGAVHTIRRFHPVIALSAYHFPEDKKEIPEIILGIVPEYSYELSRRAEEDYIFWYPTF